jgi:hypothetical protein
MEKNNKLLFWAGMIIASINIFWLGYDFYQYKNFEKWFIDLKAYKIFIELIYYGIWVSFISHLFVGITIISSLKNAPNYQSVRIGILILGCFSFFFLYGDSAALNDILNEYPQGFEINSTHLRGLWIVLIIHFSFYFFSLIYLLIIKSTNHVAISRSIQLEKLFILLNCIGVVCGILGLISVYVSFQVRRHLYKSEIISFIRILIPYLFILSYWIIQSIKDKKSGWHDEKQKSDLRKSAIITLLFSIIIMFVFFITNYGKIHGAASILWLPFYIYVVLVLFSTMALYNYKFN